LPLTWWRLGSSGGLTIATGEPLALQNYTFFFGRATPAIAPNRPLSAGFIFLQFLFCLFFC